MNTQDQDCGQTGGEVELSLADRWIVSRLQDVEAEVAEQIENYRFDQMAKALYSFIWDEYCSWYVELSKIVLNNESASAEQLRGTRQTLVRVLETLLRLVHPVMPFISEEIWQRVRPLAGVVGDTVMHSAFPRANSDKIDTEAVREMRWVRDVIGGVRNIRGEMNISPSKLLPILLEHASDEDLLFLGRNQHYLSKFGRFESVTVLQTNAQSPESATALVGKMRVLIPLGSFIDADAELRRLEKELEKTDKEIAGVNGRLSNAAFVEKAPTEVIEKAQAQLSDALQTRKSLLEQADRIRAL
jgi:valyl-tRNA synthetase